MYQQFSYTVFTLTVETNTTDNDSDRHLDDTDRTDAEYCYTRIHKHTHTHRAMRMFLILANVFISFSFFCFFLIDAMCLRSCLRANPHTVLSHRAHTVYQNTHFRLLLARYSSKCERIQTHNARAHYCVVFYLFFYLFFSLRCWLRIRIFTSMQNATSSIQSN